MSGNVTRTWEDVKERALNSGDDFVVGGSVTAPAKVQAVVATVTGVLAEIDANADFVNVVSSVITKVVLLPIAVTGKVIRIYVDTVGCSLQSAVATDDLNTVGIGGGTVEAILVAGIIYKCYYNNGNWVMTGLDNDGVVSTVVVPA